MTKLCPRGKAAAKRKFKVYPSAYANAYASKICAGKAKDPSGVKRKDWGPKKMNEGKEVKVKKKIPQSRIITDKKKKVKSKIIPYVTFNKRQSVLKNDNNKTVEKGKMISVGASKGKFDVNLNLDQSKQKSKYFKEKNIKRGITGSYRGNKGNVSINVSKDKRSNPYSGSLSGTSVNISGKIRLDKIFNKNKGGEMKVKQIDPLGKRLSDAGFSGGASKAKVKKKRPMNTTQIATARAAQLPISTKMEGKKYGLKIPTKRFDSKGKDKFAQFKKLVLKKRNRKNPTRDFLPRAGQTTIREAHYQTYGPNYKKTKKPDDKFEKYSKGGNMKIKKANMGAAMMFKDDIRGKGALLPMFGLAGMAKYQSMNKKKNNMPEDKKASGITKKETEGLAGGGMPEPTGSGSYIKQDIDGDESFTNASAQAYYKDLLD